MKRISTAVIAAVLMAGCAKGGADSADASAQGGQADMTEPRDAEDIRDEQVADIVASKLSGNDEGLTLRMEGRANEMIDSKRAEIDGTIAALEAMRGKASGPLNAEAQASADAAAARAEAAVRAIEAQYGTDAAPHADQAVDAAAATHDGAADAAADAAEAAADAAERGR